MKKRTFLGLDTTPRRALWAEINSLKWSLQEVSEQLRQARSAADVRDLKQSAEAIALETAQKSLDEADRKVTSLTKSLRRAEGERVAALKRCAALEDRLARYERPKDSRGRFCKKKAS